MSKVIKKFRLLYLRTTNQDNDFIVEFCDDNEYHYYGWSAKKLEFDSEEEAIQFAINNSPWKSSEFTIIPFWSIIE